MSTFFSISQISRLKSEIALTINLAVPIMVSQLGLMLMGLADTIQVGRMKHDAVDSLGASGTANGIYITISIIGYITLQMISPLIAKAKSSNQFSECKQLLFSNIKVSFWLSFVCMALIGIVALLYPYLGQTIENKRFALPYLFIISLSIFPSFLFTAVKGFTDGFSDTKVSMIITLLALILNVFLNECLINGLFFFPELGLNGAGIATFLSRCFMASMMIIYVLKNKNYKSILAEKIVPLSSKNFAVRNQLAIKMLKMGLPSGLQGFFEIAAFSFAVIMMGWLGNIQQAAHIIAINIAALTYMAATGIGAAGGIRVGNSIGLKDRNLQTESILSSLFVSIVFMGTCAIVMYFFRDYFVSFYTKETQVLLLSSSLLVWGAVFQLFDGLQVVCLGLLRGMQDMKIPTLITVFSYWGIGIPSGYLFAFVFRLDAVGVWIGLTLSLVASSTLLGLRLLYCNKKL